MFPKNPSLHHLLGIGGMAIWLGLFAQPVESVQGQEAFCVSTKISVGAKVMKKESTSAVETSRQKKFPSRNAGHTALSAARKLEVNKITSIFVRTNDSRGIEFSLLIAYKGEFTQAVRELVGAEVTPLLISVSTLPGRTAYFDPALLRFEQRGRSWQPSPARNAIDIWPWEEGRPFGGMLADTQIHQGVILLPDWFDTLAPITLRYGDFHYLARFTER